MCGAGAPLRVSPLQSDRRVAVLVLATWQAAARTHADPWTEHASNAR